MDNVRSLAAEFVGTFALVFVATGAIVTSTLRPGQVGLVGEALANASILAVMVTALMRISGAHFNPAVTFSLWLANKVDAKTAGAYVGTQLVAASTASLLIMLIFPQAAGQAVALGTPSVAGEIDLIGAILIEAVFTFFLVSAVFGTVVSTGSTSSGWIRNWLGDGFRHIGGWTTYRRGAQSRTCIWTCANIPTVDRARRLLGRTSCWVALSRLWCGRRYSCPKHELFELARSHKQISSIGQDDDPANNISGYHEFQNCQAASYRPCLRRSSSMVTP